MDINSIDRALAAGCETAIRRGESASSGQMKMILGHGVDIASVEEITRLINAPGEHFLARCFTERERASIGIGANKSERLAARFAAKEAVMKALGTGFGGDVGFVDVEILISHSGAPDVVLHRGARAAATALGVVRWFITASHESGIAIASAIAEGE